jgi:hypothetical protein
MSSSIERTPWDPACDENPIGLQCALAMTNKCDVGYNQPVTCFDEYCFYDPTSTNQVYRSALVDPNSGCSTWYYQTSLRNVPEPVTKIADDTMQRYCNSEFGKNTPECSCLNFATVPEVEAYCAKASAIGTDPKLCEVNEFLVSRPNGISMIKFNHPNPYYCWHASCHENPNTQLLTSDIRSVLGTGDAKQWHMFETVIATITKPNSTVYEYSVTSMTAPTCSPICMLSQDKIDIKVPITVPGSVVKIGDMVLDCGSDGSVPTKPYLVVSPIVYTMPVNEPIPHQLMVHVSNGGSLPFNATYVGSDDPWIFPTDPVGGISMNGNSSIALGVLVDVSQISPRRDPETGKPTVVGDYETVLHYTLDPLKRRPVPPEFVADIPIKLHITPEAVVRPTVVRSRISLTSWAWIVLGVVVLAFGIYVGFRKPKSIKPKSK